MPIRDLSSLKAHDANHPIEIASRIWWVGQYRAESSFQAHVYLIEHGDRSVLIDPGSRITIQETLRKVQEVTKLENIRYLVCQHQDPDITASLPLLDEILTHPDLCILTHWRAETLLEHYDLRMPFKRIEEQGWRLDLGGRALRFIFTPYAHFPGAFCTYDEQERVVFSSDIFGGFSEGFELVARDQSFFEGMRPFHEHYIPSREIMAHAIGKLGEVPIDLIAPQHGMLIPKDLIEPAKKFLLGLDCGLYMLAGGEIRRLSQLNQVLRDITLAMLSYRDFRDIAEAVLDIVKELLPATSLIFYSQTEQGEHLLLAPGNRYRARRCEPPTSVRELLGVDRAGWKALHSDPFVIGPATITEDAAAEALVPLFAPGGGVVNAVAVIALDTLVEPDEPLVSMVEQISVSLQVAVERQLVYHALDIERQQYYERSIRDPLTKCFTRFYMHDTVSRLLHMHDRDASAKVSVLLVDIDHFKAVNDAFGHNRGDDVLRRVAGVFLEESRNGDLAVRLGGEEFGIFLTGTSADHIGCFAERVRARVEVLDLGPDLDGYKVTISGGVARRATGETLDELLERADVALYRAKHEGRNKIVDSEAP